MDHPVRSPIRKSLLRPLLVLGGERELVMASGMLTAILVFSVANPVAAGIGIAFWVASLAVFGRMAKNDPQLLKVYIRHVNKKLYYPARPHFTALDPEIKKHL
jgi:type IV secretory pathway TrbD component